MTLALALPLVLALAWPHHARLVRRLSPGTAVAVWTCVLLLRALAGLSAAAAGMVVVPRTHLFALVSDWCWHVVLPGLNAHVGFDGHQVLDLVVLLPGVLVLLSTLAVAIAVARAARAAARLVGQRTVGEGPLGSVVIHGPQISLAVAGLAHPRVVVSAGALARLDQAELAAGVEHERGHIAHHHRFLSLLGEVCRGFGCFIPGGRAAVRELTFHLERDADQFALRHHDPLDLASAICKTAGSVGRAPALACLAGEGAVIQRVHSLLEDEMAPRRSRRSVGAVAAACLITLVVAATLPSAVAAGTVGPRHSGPETHCPS